jgi:hypothetical protein
MPFALAPPALHTLSAGVAAMSAAFAFYWRLRSAMSSAAARLRFKRACASTSSGAVSGAVAASSASSSSRRWRSWA